MSANPHANGGLLLRDLALPDFRDYAVEVPAPGSTIERGDHGCWASSCATSIERNPTNVPAVRPGRDRVQPPRSRSSRPPTASGWRADCPTDEHLAPDGRVMEVLSRAPLPGLAGGLPADRPARPLQLLRGVHPHRRLDVQPARQVAEDDARDPLAPADRLAQLPADQPRLAPGPQRLQPPGPGLHRPRRQQEGRGHPGLPAARRQHAAVGRRPLPAQPATTSTSSSPASSRP